MKTYIDTVILNKMVDDLWRFREDRESFGKILNLYPNSFWVSETLTLQEINNISAVDHKEKVLGIYDRMNKISVLSSLSYSDGLVSFGSVSSVQDPDRTILREIFTPNNSESSAPKENYIPHFQNNKGKQITADADHIYNSFKSGCDYFLTVDRKLIKRYTNNKSRVDKIISPMKIVDPPTLLGLLSEKL